MVYSDGRWKLDKGSRVALCDGNNVFVWLKQQKCGWKFDNDRIGIIYPYNNLLNLGELMNWLESYALGMDDADCRKTNFTESTLDIPNEFEWIDQTGEGIARMEAELPIKEFVGINAEEADGKKRKVNLALRNDNQWQSWNVDGGI